MMEQLERIANLLEQLVKDNREFIELAKERDEKVLEIQEAHLHVARYYFERERLVSLANHSIAQMERLQADIEVLQKAMALTGWTLIDNYNNDTWPEDDSTIVEACQWQPEENQWWVGLLGGTRLIYLSSLNDYLLDAYYWRPFTPPRATP